MLLILRNLSRKANPTAINKQIRPTDQVGLITLVAMDPNIAAFLIMIRRCEGTYTLDDEGYRCLFGWTKDNHKCFKSYADHPRKFFPYRDGTTSAAGAYQMLVGTYDDLHKRGFMKDFSPGEQDKGAVQLLKECGAYRYVLAGQFGAALLKARNIWASIPGAKYGQPTKSFVEAQRYFVDAGGAVAA